MTKDSSVRAEAVVMLESKLAFVLLVILQEMISMGSLQQMDSSDYDLRIPPRFGKRSTHDLANNPLDVYNYLNDDPQSSSSSLTKNDSKLMKSLLEGLRKHYRRMNDKPFSKKFEYYDWN